MKRILALVVVALLCCSAFAARRDEEILNKLAALPVTSWRYKNDDSRQRYIGPMAQDFHALFGLGTDTTLATLDVEGVTIAAVKALQSENATLRDRLENVTKRLEQVEAELTKK